MLENLRDIGLGEWHQRVRARCRTLSGQYLPLAGCHAYEYTCPADEFLNRSTYLVRFLSRDGSRIVAFDDPEATPITITEFVEKPEFVRALLRTGTTKTRDRSGQQTCLSSIVALVAEG